MLVAHRLMMAGALSLAGTGAWAQVTPIQPFAGEFFEGFEDFPDYRNGGRYLTRNIMGDYGQIHAYHEYGMIVYNPGEAGFGLGDKLDATVHSGIQGLGQDYGQDITGTPKFTVSFDSAIREFGGWWNYAVVIGLQFPDSMSLSFFDSSNNLIDSVDERLPFDSGMYWLGYRSNVGIKTIEVTGNYVVMDDLQANAVPEPLSLGVLVVGLVAFLQRRRGK